MSKTKYLLPTALLAGGMTIGAVFSPIGLAGAQDDGTTEAPESDSGSESDDGHRRHRGHRAEHLAETLGISVEELRAGVEADKTLVEIVSGQMTEAELVAALTDAANSRIDEALANGRIDEAKATEAKAKVAERIAEGVNVRPSERDGHRHGRRGFGRLGAGEALDALGISGDELRAGFEAGNTLAETAAEQGVTEAELVDALVAAAQERVDQALENDRIDDDRAAELAESIEERISDMVNRQPGDRPERPADGATDTGLSA